MSEFQVVAFENPFTRPSALPNVPAGATVSEIIDQLGIDPSLRLSLVVRITIGSRCADVPINSWHLVRPNPGTLVEIFPRVQGPATMIALANVLVTASAPFLATAAGFATGTLGFHLAVAGISMVGAMLVNSLIAPPQHTTTKEDPVFNISAASNTSRPYEVFPTVIGRRLFYPEKTARGYTETVDGEVYLRERMTFGYGPVAISDLKIGNTPIEEFDGVEVEFLNVDQYLSDDIVDVVVPEDAETGAGQSFIVKGWRKGTEALRLYPTDVSPENFSVLLEAATPVVRATAVGTDRAQIDVSFQALMNPDSNGNPGEITVDVGFEYREQGDTVWIDAGTLTCTGATRQFIRFTKEIEFATEGVWEIRLSRLTPDDTSPSNADLANLTAIRSFQTGGIPSNPNIAEMAIRIKATDELNGSIQSLNAVVHQLAPTHNGTAWENELNWTVDSGKIRSGLALVEHPAWSFAHVLRGPQLETPVPDARIGIADLVDWATQEPHWRCDEVFTGSVTVREVLRFIAAAGRAKFAPVDLKWSVVRDGGAGGIVQHFTPRNSYNFSGKRTLTERPHALRMQFTSEDAGWAKDEITVYNDGYDANSATNIETMELPGVVLRSDDVDQANIWRLGRYYLAVASLRREEFTFSANLDQIRCQFGSKVRISHDAPLIGVGYGRIKELAGELLPGTTIVLDEAIEHVPTNSHRMRVRRQDGTEVVFDVTPGADRFSWTTGYDLFANGCYPDDMVMLELTTTVPTDVLITNIENEHDLSATLTAVLAAPEVLTADTGVIPPYVPNVTDNALYGPPKPVVVEVLSNQGTSVKEQDRSLTPRISVRIAPMTDLADGNVVSRVRWRENKAGAQWIVSYQRPVSDLMHTGRLVVGRSYQVAVQTLAETTQKSQGWVNAGVVVASVDGEPLEAMTGWVGASVLDAVILSATISDELPDFDEFRLYSATASNPTLTFIGASKTSYFRHSPSATETRYVVTWANNSGVESTPTSFIDVLPRQLAPSNLVALTTDNLFPDVGFVDAGFYTAETGSFTLGRTTIGGESVGVITLPSGGASRIVSDWLPIDRDTEYRATMRAWLFSDAGINNAGTVYADIECTNYTPAGDVDETIIDVHQIAFQADGSDSAIQEQVFKTRSFDTLYRLVMRRDVLGLEDGRFAEPIIHRMIDRNAATDDLRVGAGRLTEPAQSVFPQPTGWVDMATLVKNKKTATPMDVFVNFDYSSNIDSIVRMTRNGAAIGDFFLPSSMGSRRPISRGFYDDDVGTGDVTYRLQVQSQGIAHTLTLEPIVITVLHVGE